MSNQKPDTEQHGDFPQGLKGLAGALAQIDHQFVGVLCILFIMGGMVASEAMMSMGMIFLAASAVFNLNFPDNMRHFFKHRALVALMLIFVVYFVSGLWSENTAWWLDRVRMKLPFLLMPMAIVSIPRLDRQVYLKLLYAFFIWISLASLHSLALYLADYEAINSAYREGRVLPTPVQHIRFSLMVAFCVAVGAYLLRERFVWKYRWERRLIQIVTIFLIVYLHILAVRSGLLALYAMMLYYAALLVWERKQYLLAGGLAVAMAVAGWLAYQYVPSFQNRINYSLYTFRVFEKQEQISDLSDARRIGSLYAAADMLKSHPLTGVGAGDVRDATDAYLQQHYPSLAGFQLMPHNQFLHAGASAGIPGMLIFTLALLWPLLYRRAWRDPLLTAFYVLMLSSCMVEHTLETQLGTAFFILFALMALRYLDEPHAPRQRNAAWKL